MQQLDTPPFAKINLLRNEIISVSTHLIDSDVNWGRGRDLVVIRPREGVADPVHRVLDLLLQQRVGEDLAAQLRPPRPFGRPGPSRGVARPHVGGVREDALDLPLNRRPRLQE